MLHSLRVRLTAWFLLVFGLLLTVFSLGLYLQLAHEAEERLTQTVVNAAQTVAKGFRGQLAENKGNLAAATAHTLNEFRPAGLYLGILSNHELLGSNFSEEKKRLSDDDDLRPVLPGDEMLELARATQRPVLFNAEMPESAGVRVAILSIPDASNVFIVVAESRESLRQELASFRRVLLLSTPAILLIAGLAGLFLARQALAPVAAMSEQAERISAKNLHERLPVQNPKDELGRLAAVINDLLARLSRSFDNLRTFTADASHELRTPLAIIKGETGVALSRERPLAEYQDTLQVIESEADHLTQIVEDMLALARADAGQQQLQLQPLYLNDLLEDCIRSVQVLAERKSISLRLEPVSDLPIQGDEKLLRRLILNLLDNAIKYTPMGGSVTVELQPKGNVVQLCVADTGQGISPEEQSYIFERFYRADKVRSRAEGGSGLGLPIVRWIAEAHRGTVSVRSQPGQGSVFTVELPLLNHS